MTDTLTETLRAAGNGASKTFAPAMPAQAQVPEDYYNTMAHDLVGVAFGQIGRGNDAAVRSFLEATRHILDLDRMTKTRAAR